MYTLRLLLALLAGSFTSSPSTGTGPNTDVLSCYADEANTALRKQDPTYARKSDSLDYAWSAAVESGHLQGKSAFAPPYVLPIVFHIIHENGPENIPDADVQRSVDFLNQALANTDYYDPTDEGSLIWNDPAMAITWPLDNPTLSDKDSKAPTFAELFQ